MIDTLFITGCGGDIAISIARFVREDGLARRIVGADLREDQPGFAFVDQVMTLPRADAADYVDALFAARELTGAELILPMSEAELGRLLAEALIGNDKARLLTANDRALQVGLDKLETARTLAAAGVGTPRTGLIGTDRPDVERFIVKPRKGQGSKGIALAEAWNRDHLLATRTGDIWQEFLPESDQEFTCGLIRLPGMGTRSIALRRTLTGGLTSTAVVVDDPIIEESLGRIADAVDLNGAINVQLRLDQGIPKVFEINPRFSSTVGFRHRLGFQDFVWSLEATVGRPISAYRPPVPGTRLYRVGTEVIRAPADDG